LRVEGSRLKVRVDDKAACEQAGAEGFHNNEPYTLTPYTPDHRPSTLNPNL
jgi:hypothetical protein